MDLMLTDSTHASLSHCKVAEVDAGWPVHADGSERQCFSSPIAWAGGRDDEMQRAHILCNGKQQQLLMLGPV